MLFNGARYPKRRWPVKGRDQKQVGFAATALGVLRTHGIPLPAAGGRQRGQAPFVQSTLRAAPRQTEPVPFARKTCRTPYGLPRPPRCATIEVYAIFGRHSALARCGSRWQETPDSTERFPIARGRLLATAEPLEKPRQASTCYPVLGVCALLLLAIGMVFGQTVRFGFVNYDDDQTVYGNPQVTRGLTVQGVAWAFTHRHFRNWIPLTCLSHMLDCRVYGLNAAGHHLTNVLLHAATTVLLFLVLRQMTGQTVAECVSGGAIRGPSSTRGIGGLGDGAEGCPQRAVFRACARGVHKLCASSIFCRPLLGDDGFLCAGTDGQADVGDATGGAAAVGLLAARAVRRQFASSANAAKSSSPLQWGGVRQHETYLKPCYGGFPLPGGW